MIMAVEITRSGETVNVQSAAWKVDAAQAAYSLAVHSAIIVGGIPYGGAYEVTPSSETQTLPTESRMLAQNIVVNPVPSNYGLFTWDGSTITVS